MMNYAKQIMKEINGKIDELPPQAKIRMIKAKIAELELANDKDKKAIEKRSSEIVDLLGDIWEIEKELHKAKQDVSKVSDE